MKNKYVNKYSNEKSNLVNSEDKDKINIKRRDYDRKCSINKENFAKDYDQFNPSEDNAIQLPIQHENRDKRNIDSNVEDGTKVTASSNMKLVGKSTNENEECLIKEHIKRLSEEEFNDLLQSLSDSKKELLRKIIDNNNLANLNKRDITKKAGAVEDNGLNDNIQIDFNKMRSEVPPNIMSKVTTSDKINEKKDIDKQEFQPIISTIKENEITNSTNDDNVNTMSSTSVSTLENEKNNDTKTKRDANGNFIMHKNYPKIQETTADFDVNIQNADDEYFCSEDDDFSNLMDYESRIHSSNNKKREVTNDISDSVKSLEESFPKSNTNTDDYIDLIPLVRVKRKNSGTTIRDRSVNNPTTYDCNKDNSKELNSHINNNQEQYNDEPNFYFDNKHTNLRSDIELSNNIEKTNENLISRNGVKSKQIFNTNRENIEGMNTFSKDNYNSIENEYDEYQKNYQFEQPNYKEGVARYKRIRDVKNSIP